jgi:hypothetical protein
MSKLESSTKCTNVQRWEDILADMKATLDDDKSRMRRLKRSIRAIEEKIAKGEPLPEYLKTQG